MQRPRQHRQFGAAAISLSQWEEQCYRDLFSQADVDPQGRLGGAKAVAFLSRTGLARPQLKQIWDIADERLAGWLGFKEFSAAMRLVAHAQSGAFERGAAITKDYVNVKPPALPRLKGVQPPGLRGGANTRGRSPPRGEDRSMPTQRQLRKYGRLFVQMTQGRQPPMVTASAAREVFSKSGLSHDILVAIWDMADHDRDAMLGFPEFVLAMHLIRRTLAGQPLQAVDSYPKDLFGFLGSLEPAEVYANQGSRSLSAHSDPFRDDSRSPSPAPGFGDGSGDGGPGGFGSSGFTSGGFGSGSPTGFGGGGGLPDTPAGSDGKKKKKKSKANLEEMPTKDELDLSGDLSATTMRGDRHSRSSLMGQSPQSQPEPLEVPKLRHDAQPIEHLEVLAEVDKKLVNQLRQDTDELDSELARLEEACRKEADMTNIEREEAERIGKEREHLLKQLDVSQNQLRELKAEYQGLHTESVLLRRDHDHYGREAVFLQRLVDESTRDAESLQQSIEYLDQSNQSLLAHTRALEEARHEVLLQVQEETEKLEKEQEQAKAARQVLEDLRKGSTDRLAPRFGAAERPEAASSAPALGFDAAADDGIQRPRRTSTPGGLLGGGYATAPQPSPPFVARGGGGFERSARPSAPARNLFSREGV